ncbi:hypothetical protein H8S90_24895 [Olivibacter sp. SDN3]|uniref:class I SAM-dependent methyltransferase n=1 Tax=Olivibacter sp. SDN3 TaxID=2764720 RepID=UPI00165154FA|nr:class I SAM-dependent methyltransferase [Olivibacter sp. SDN3]QNL49892.1 hypothetical protein H8S90_24895 [Olivibacter sp. SDN3]
MNTAILTAAVQDFLRKHITMSPAILALSKSPFTAVSSRELASQLDGLRRSQKKLPLWHHTPGVYFPELLALEQSSSSLTARYKSSLIPPNCTVIDLTGGFGVDSYYFSIEAKEVIHCERQPELSLIAAHNADQLGAKNIQFIAGDGLAYLKTAEQQFTVIYIDPSRRVKQQKVFRLSDGEPNVVEEQAFLQTKGDILLIKAAPLLDIKAALEELKYVKEVHILSVQNECKELLFVIEHKYNGLPRYCCAALHPQQEQQLLTFSKEQEENAVVRYTNPKKYLYEPDASLLKAGCFKYLANFFHLEKLQKHTHLYTSAHLNSTFMGRTFEVLSFETYAAFKKRKERQQANISTRNFPLKPEEIKRKHRIKDGGDSYLFFCTGFQKELMVIRCKKIT